MPSRFSEDAHESAADRDHQFMKEQQMTDLISPTVNLNGNDREDLFDKARDIARALQGVLDAFQRGTDLVHGRNHPYRPLGPIAGSGPQAREAFGERANAVHKMLHEFTSMALDIQRQGS